jgi:TolA-binding protein
MGKEKSMVNPQKGNGEKTGQQEKLSYEQLEQIANNLNQQCRQMQEHIRNLQNVIAEFNEISMLLDILGKSEHFNEDFVIRCSSKIEELIIKALDASEKQEEKVEN